MIASSTKVCQRCKSSFICNMNDISNCQCNSIVLNEQTNEFLKKTKYDCLCKNCLNEINDLIKTTNHKTFPRNAAQLEEGLHYYMENGFFVFTEFYHMLRGHCCGNGCKHCAYGFKK